MIAFIHRGLHRIDAELRHAGNRPSATLAVGKPSSRPQLRRARPGPRSPRRGRGSRPPPGGGRPADARAMRVEEYTAPLPSTAAEIASTSKPRLCPGGLQGRRHRRRARCRSRNPSRPRCGGTCASPARLRRTSARSCAASSRSKARSTRNRGRGPADPHLDAERRDAERRQVRLEERPRVRLEGQHAEPAVMRAAKRGRARSRPDGRDARHRNCRWRWRRRGIRRCTSLGWRNRRMVCGYSVPGGSVAPAGRFGTMICASPSSTMVSPTWAGGGEGARGPWPGRRR